MGRIVYSMENGGDSITIENKIPKGYFKEAGSDGMGVAPTALRMTEGAGGGAIHRNTRRGPKEIILPVLFFGENADEIEASMDRLLRILSDTVTTPKLVATYPDGRQYETEFHYQDGADAPLGSDSDGRFWARWPLQLRTTSPYWTARTPIQFSVRTGSSGRGLIKTGNGGLSRLRLSGSQAIGTIEIENPGHVDAFPIWTIKGPGDNFKATLEANGHSFEYEVPILSSTTITVNTQTKKVTDQTGANKYTSLAKIPAPRLFSIPPGSSKIQILLTNATSDSLVTMFFLPRREFVFG